MTFKTFFNRLDKGFSTVNSGTVFGVDDKSISMTDQTQSYDADINNIMQDNYVCGCSKVNKNRRPLFGDFTQFTSDKLVDSLNYVKKAESEFNNLPSDIRARFNNEPNNLLEFVNDPSNYDEAVKLGICQARAQEPEPVKVKVISEPASESSSS